MDQGVDHFFFVHAHQCTCGGSAGSGVIGIEIAQRDLMSAELGKGAVSGVADQWVIAGEVHGNVGGEFGFALERGGNNGFDDGTGLRGLKLLFKEDVRSRSRLAGSASIDSEVAKCSGDKGHDGVIGGG